MPDNFYDWLPMGRKGSTANAVIMSLVTVGIAVWMLAHGWFVWENLVIPVLLMIVFVAIALYVRRPELF